MSTRHQWDRFSRDLAFLNRINAGTRGRALYLKSAVDFMQSRGVFETSVSGGWKTKLWALSAKFEAAQRAVEALNAAAAAVASTSAALVSTPDGHDFDIRALTGAGADIQRAATMPGALGFALALPIVLKAGAALLGGLLIYSGLAKVSDTIIESKNIDRDMQAAGLEMDRAIASNPGIIADWARYKQAIADQGAGGGGALARVGSGAIWVGLVALVAWAIMKKLGDR